MTEEDLRTALDAYAEARRARDAAIVRAASEMKQTDVVRITGFSREYIRRLVRAAERGDET